MNVHTVLFFKTYLQYAQLSHDQTWDIHMNSTLVILNPTHGHQALPMDKLYKYNSVQPLVHSVCHQLPKQHMGAPCSFNLPHFGN